MELSEMDVPALLDLHGQLIEELRHRGVCRTSNNPVADYTEWLVARTLKLSLDGNSQAGYDATDTHGRRYQIKGRRRTPHNSSVQLSVIRNLPQFRFDYLIGVVFDHRFGVDYAAQVPHAVVLERASHNTHQNGHILHLKRSLFDEPGVVDLTSVLRAA